MAQSGSKCHSLKKISWEFRENVFADQCRSAEKEPTNTINVVGSGALKSIS